MLFFRKRDTNQLTERDDLYKNIISKLPLQNRISYCESLIYRTQKDLLTSKCPRQKRKIKELLKAAEKELKKLT